MSCNERCSLLAVEKALVLDQSHDMQILRVWEEFRDGCKLQRVSIFAWRGDAWGEATQDGALLPLYFEVRF